MQKIMCDGGHMVRDEITPIPSPSPAREGREQNKIRGYHVLCNHYLKWSGFFLNSFAS